MGAAWPLVERDDHLRLIAEAVGNPLRQALVITGVPGMGKTRLAVEALRQLEGHGVATRWVVATQAVASVPFAAVAHLMPGGGSAETAVDLLVRASRAMADDAAGRRVVVGVDDVHLLDHASAALIGHLAVSRSAFILCTLRSGESAPDPVAMHLAMDDAGDLALDPLSTDAITSLLTRALGGQVDGAAVHRLARLCDGNPMLLRGLFEDARRQGALHASGRLWRLAETWSPTVRLPELISDRLERLSREGLEAAQVLALAEPLETSILESLFEAQTLRTLDDAGLLESLPDERRHRLRFVHPLYGEAIRGAITPLRARTLHRRLADALAAPGLHRRDDLVRLATWWLAGGQTGHGPTFAAAARQASAMFDHRLAERFARAAHAAGGGEAAALALADALRWQGRRAEAEDLLAGWSDETGQGTVLPFVGSYGNAAAGQDDASTRLAQAETLVSDRAGRDRLVAARADLAFGRWQPREALRLARPLMEDPNAEADVVAMASETAAGALAFAGRTDDSLAVVASALDLIRSGAAMAVAVLERPLLAESCFAHMLAGRLQQSRLMSVDGYRWALDHGVAAPRAWFGLLLASLDLLEGRVPNALQEAAEATELMREHPAAQGRNIQVWGLGLLAEAAALLGQLQTAQVALDQADDLLDPAIPNTPRALGRAWTAAAAGHVTEARATALSAADGASDGGALAFEAFALHDVIRLRADGHELRAASDRLESLVSETDGGLFPALSAHATALRGRDAEALDRAAAGMASLGLVLRAAEASADAARLWGDRPQSRASAARARELGARCAGVRTPALVLDDDRSGLTAREREIAALAASGHSSRDIATRLVISVRTVDNHLHRIYAKLGINRREDLPI